MAVTHSVRISFTAGGTPVVVRAIGTIAGAADRAQSSTNSLRNALGLLGGGISLKGIIDMADSMTNLQNRLKFVSKSQEEAVVTQTKLLEVANRSRSSLESTAELYSRVALSATQMKLSHEQVTRVVETMNKAVILSGANTREAEAAIIQFSQGLAQGALRGQEMRSVMEQIPYVADILAAKMGVTRGALRAMGSEGKVSADIMVQALLEASKKVDNEFSKTMPTLGQSMVVLRNQMLDFIDQTNQKFSVLPRLTAILKLFGDNIDIIGRVALAGAFVTGLKYAITGINALFAAIQANPWGLAATGILLAAAALVTFSDNIKLTEKSQATLADFLAVSWEEIKNVSSNMADNMVNDYGFVGDSLRKIFGDDFAFSVKDFLLLGARMRDGFVGTVKGGVEVILVIWRNLGPAMENIFKGIANGIIASLEFLINQFVKGINALTDNKLMDKLGIGGKLMDEVTLNRWNLSKEAAATGDQMGKAFKDAFNNETAGVELVKNLQVKAEGRAADRLIKQELEKRKLQKGEKDFTQTNTPDASLKDQRGIAMDEINLRLKEEAEGLAYVGRSRTAHIELIKLEQGLRRKGITLGEEERTALLTQLEENQTLKQKASIMDDVVGSMEENARAQQIVNDLVKEGGVNTGRYADKLRELKIAALSQNRDVASGFQRGFLSVQDEVGNFAKLSEQTVTNAFGNMEDAFVDFVKTGKLSFSGLVDSMLSDLTRLLLRQAVMGLVGSLGGGFGGVLAGVVGGAASGAAGGARAAGGPVSSGKAYLVGEQGPEIFQPNSSGAIVPNGTAMGGMAPQVNVTVVNSTDPDEVANVLADPRHDKLIMNVLRRNKGAAKSSLGLA